MKTERLGNHVGITNGYAFISSEYIDKGARIVRLTNVQKGKIKDIDPKYYPLTKTSNLDKYKILKNAILMSLTGNVGRVGKYPENFCQHTLINEYVE